MGRIVVTEFVSLDGVMEDPGGAEDFKYGGWSFEIERGEEGDRFKLDEALNADALLLGRRTYEGFAAAWPSRSGDPFADKFNAMPKYVVSGPRAAGGAEPAGLGQPDARPDADGPRPRRRVRPTVLGGGMLSLRMTPGTSS